MASSCLPAQWLGLWLTSMALAGSGAAADLLASALTATLTLALGVACALTSRTKFRCARPRAGSLARLFGQIAIDGVRLANALVWTLARSGSLSGAIEHEQLPPEARIANAALARAGLVLQHSLAPDGYVVDLAVATLSVHRLLSDPGGQAAVGADSHP